MTTTSQETLLPIPFAQYVLPPGCRREVWIERPVEVAGQAQRLIEDGCRFEIEILTTGQVSMTCERDIDEGETEVIAMEICDNGPAVRAAVDRLVATAIQAGGYA